MANLNHSFPDRNNDANNHVMCSYNVALEAKKELQIHLTASHAHWCNFSKSIGGKRIKLGVGSEGKKCSKYHQNPDEI